MESVLIMAGLFDKVNRSLPGRDQHLLPYHNAPVTETSVNGLPHYRAHQEGAPVYPGGAGNPSHPTPCGDSPDTSGSRGTKNSALARVMLDLGGRRHQTMRIRPQLNRSTKWFCHIHFRLTPPVGVESEALVSNLLRVRRWNLSRRRRQHVPLGAYGFTSYSLE